MVKSDEHLEFGSLALFLFNLNLTQSSTDFKALLENGIFIIIYIVLFIFLGLIIYWIFKKEYMMILPFDAVSDINNPNGKAISHLLKHELNKIYRIHNVERMKNLSIANVNTASISLAPTTESLTYSLSPESTITLGSTSIPIGQFLNFIKQQTPRASPGRVITGSLQRYGNLYVLVAKMDGRDIRTWTVERKCDEKEIPDLIRELAFKIANDLSTDSKATWKGLRYYTEGLEAFDRYMRSDDLDDLNEAEGLCFDAIEEGPGYYYPYSLLYPIIEKYIAKKQYRFAEDVSLKILELRGNSDIAAFSFLGYIYEYGSTEKYIADRGQAKINYEKAVKLTPRDAIDWSYRGFTYLIMGEYDNKNYDNAIKDIDEAIARNQKYVDNLINKGSALYSLGRYEEAIEVSKKAIELDKENVTAWNIKGNALSGQKKHEEAIKAYDEAIRLNLTEPVYWHIKGNALKAQGNFYEAKRLFDEANRLFDEAIRAYDDAFELNSSDHTYRCNRGNAFYSLEKYDQAIKEYDEAIKLNPSEPTYWNNRGNALCYKKEPDYDQAIKEYDKAIELNPSETTYWNNRGNAFFSLGKHGQAAIKDFDEAIRLNPSEPTFWNNRGNAFFSLGRYGQAIKDCDKAIRLNPYNPDYWNNKGKAYKKKYDKALNLNKFIGYWYKTLYSYRAVKAYDKAIELNPSEPDYWNNRGDALFSKKEYDAAIKDYDEAIRLNLFEPDYWRKRGDALYSLEKFDLAIKEYDQAIRLNLFEPDYWMNRADALKKLNRELEADFAIAKAKELGYKG